MSDAKGINVLAICGSLRMGSYNRAALRTAIELRLHVEHDAAFIFEELFHQRPSAADIRIMRDGKYHSVGGAQCSHLHKLDAVFVLDLARIGHRVVHLDR